MLLQRRQPLQLKRQLPPRLTRLLRRREKLLLRQQLRKRPLLLKRQQLSKECRQKFV
jgi:hypothetical protein